MKQVVLSLLFMIGILPFAISSTDTSTTNGYELKQVQIDAKMAWAYVDNEGRLIEVLRYVEEPAKDIKENKSFLIDFPDHGSALEIEDVYTLKVIAYKLMGNLNNHIYINVANNSAAYDRLVRVVEELQYLGVSTDFMVIDVLGSGIEDPSQIRIDVRERDFDFAYMSDPKIDYSLSSL